MANILYLVHRLPYPPDKGDKVRSFHLLQHLLARHQVHLGTFVDDPHDLQHLPHLASLCASLCAPRLHPLRARAASLRGLVTGQALTLPFYRHAGLARWVRELESKVHIDAVVVFSAAMAQYVAPHSGRPLLVDLVDVDSAKWTAYAQQRRGLASWVYRREGVRLAAYEAAVARQADHTLLATEKEAELFRTMVPDLAAKVHGISNGVDTEFFSPQVQRPSPYDAQELPVVFTGAMDYWPNVDAVCWFAQEALPGLRQRWPGLRLHIVGRNPTAEVRALAGEAVHVTGTVPDVRPYLQHAAVVVAPMRLARGIQNKVLEAMAMARPVVAAADCVQALDQRPDQGLVPAQTVDDYIREIDHLLAQPDRGQAAGEAARDCVYRHYRWAARLAPLDNWLP